VLPAPGADPIRVTASGGPTSFNGVPDWVYEEEVLSGETAAWWSPDGRRLAFLASDERDVPEYEFPVYNPSLTPGAQAYPDKVIMRYPKPGYSNPTVQVSLFDLGAYQDSPSGRPTLATGLGNSTAVDAAVTAVTYTLEFDSPFPTNDVVIGEVSWVSPKELLVKATNRIASVQRVAYFDLGKVSAEQGTVVGKVVREVDMAERDGGWVEAVSRICR